MAAEKMRRLCPQTARPIMIISFMKPMNAASRLPERK